MLFQTLVQLNILILATPALAGWSLLTPAHFGTVSATCIVWQYRGTQTAAPQSAAVTQARTAEPAAAASSAVPLAPVYIRRFAGAIVSLPSVPYAARAP